MSVHCYAILPIEKLNHIEHQLHEYQSKEKEANTKKEMSEKEKEIPLDETPLEVPIKKEETEESDVSPSGPVDSSPPSPTKSEKNTLPAEIKSLVKKKSLSARHLEKLIKAIETYEGKTLAIDNLSQIAKAAVGQGKKRVPNEDEFFTFIARENLFHLIKNRHMLRRHFPHWFRI